MEIKPEVMDRLLAEGDTALWETVRRIAVMNNITLPDKMPSEKDMEALRALLRSGSLRYEDAVEILARYRKGSMS